MSDNRKKRVQICFIKPVIFKLLLVTFCIVCTTSVRAEDRSMDNNFRNPEGSSLLYVYGGYGQYNWKMMSMGSLMDIFASDLPSEGMRFEHKATPYTVKRYGVKSNFLIFSLGLDYLGDTLDLPAEFDSEKELEEREDKSVKQLRYLSGIGFGNISFQFNVTLREFDSQITSRGYKTFDDNVLPVYYYTENGEQLLLNDGDKTAWYTTYDDYEGKIVWDSWLSTIEIGIKYTTYDAPTEVRIDDAGTHGDILMYTENTMVSVFGSATGLSHIAGDFYIKYYVPFNIAGYYYAENDYFRVKDKKPFSKNTFSQTASSCGNFSLAYILKHLTLEAGVDYAMYFSFLELKNVELKKDVEYYDSIYDSVTTANAGDRVNIHAERLEFFWGYYIKASAYF